MRNAWCRLVLGALALLLSSCVTRRAADFLTLPRRADDAAFWEKETKVPFRRFAVKAKDGVVLPAYELDPVPDGPKRGTAYLLHGFGNSKEQMLPVAKWLSQAGFRCVAWDSRGHGKSGGDRATFGTHEVDDALRVIRTARTLDRKPHGTEVIWAYSMGTAVALQALPELPEVRAAVLLAPIASLEGVMGYQARRRYHGALRPLMPAVRASVRNRAGFDPRSIRPSEAVKRTRCKLLLIHGESDEVIPVEQSTRILDACAPGQGRGIVLAKTSHGGVMWSLPDKIRGEAVGFLQANAPVRNGKR